MNRSLIISSVLHGALIIITAMSLPFLAKKPLDIPPIVSVELIQIAEKTNIPFAPKAKKIIEEKKKKKLKEKEKKLVSEQAPPKKVKKTKTKTVVSLDQKKEKIENQTPEAVPLPDKTVKKIETKKENKQNPDKLDEEVKQVSEFEKKEFVDLDNIAKQLSCFGAVKENQWLVRSEVEPGIVVSVFADGRLIVTGTRDPSRAHRRHPRRTGSDPGRFAGPGGVRRGDRRSTTECRAETADQGC